MACNWEEVHYLLDEYGIKVHLSPVLVPHGTATSAVVVQNEMATSLV
jgi:hypothetical protein